MAEKLYLLLYLDEDVSDYKLFASFDAAAKLYLKSAISETRKLLQEVNCIGEEEEDEAIEKIDTEDDDEDYEPDEEESSCMMQVLEYNSSTKEYVAVKDYDVEVFQSFVEDMEEVDAYLDILEESLDNDVIPDTIRKMFA